MKSLALAILLALATSPAWAQSRIKDMATIEGMGDAALVGYGMVVGLSGTGDTPLVGRGPLPPGVRVGRDAAQVMVTARLMAVPLQVRLINLKVFPVEGSVAIRRVFPHIMFPEPV